MEKTNPTKEARLFKNDFLNSMTKTTPLTSVVVYFPVIIALLYVAVVINGLPAVTVAGLFVFAFFFWTLAEYLLHRYLFHWVSDSKIVMRMHYLMHGVHHDHPRDESRLLMPPVPGLIMASFLFLIFYLIFLLIGQPQLSWAFFPGFFAGYLMYSFVHFSIHKFKPPEFLKPLWIHHNLHHYKYPDKAFGVSNTFWDRVFGTMPPKDERLGKKTRTEK
ncbi:MAG: fatty acid hydroxylase [Saprospirales bacterium]|nr:MAG: fatty acid hydroxylase [Saprospirales bacterium]